MVDRSHIEENWPELIALEEFLIGLTSTQHTVGATDDVILERLLAKLNRPGGPKISSRAIV